MPIEITSHTTNQEVQDIQAAYSQNGQVNYDQIAEDIELGQGNFDTEDLITAFVMGKGTLPPFMMAPEASIPDPDDPAVAHLWEDEVVGNLQQLGDLFPNLNPAIQNFLSYSDAAGATESADLISEIEDFLNDQNIFDEGESEQVAKDIYDLFNINDLNEVMSLFLSLGNPGMALLLYTAYALKPQMESLQEAALDIIGDSTDFMGDLMEELEDIDPADADANFLSSSISQQLDVVRTVISTMNSFIEKAQETLEDEIQLSSSLSQSAKRALQMIIGNIGG